jgi:hypothetical protein
MRASEPIPFICPGCGTKYQIVLIESSPLAARSTTIKCVHCDVALTATKGNALLQYFLRNSADQNPADVLRPLERLMSSFFALGNWCARLTRERP